VIVLSGKVLDLGKGIRFPKLFSRSTGGVAIQEGIEKVNQSIADILNTRKGERVLNPEYGSDLPYMVFELNDPATEDVLSISILRDLAYWEPRINILDISVSSTDAETDRNIMNVKITYEIRGTNIKESYIYPVRTQPRDL